MHVSSPKEGPEDRTHLKLHGCVLARLAARLRAVRGSVHLLCAAAEGERALFLALPAPWLAGRQRPAAQSVIVIHFVYYSILHVIIIYIYIYL